MLVPTVDAQKYGDQLEQFLLQLKNELLSQSKDTTDYCSGLKELDKYLLELNTFYYTSFHRKYFPLYRQIIEEDTRSLYHISRQEETLKKDIITSIKQHARLFNRIKGISVILKVKHEETKQLLLTFHPGNDERSVELLYILKELTNDWTDFRDLLSKLQTLLEDKKLLAALNQYPAHAAVANLINGWEPGNIKADRDLNRLMAGWQLAIKLLVKLQENQSPTKEATRTLKIELEKIDVSWDNRKVTPDLRSWYKQYIQKTFSFYMELINLYGEKNDLKHTIQVAGQFEDWLKALLYLLEQSLLLKSRGDGEITANTFLLTRMDKDYVRDLASYSSRILPSLEDLTNTLSSSSQADYQYHSQRSSQLLAEAYHFLKLQVDNNVKTQGILLAAKMERLKDQVALQESRIDLLNEKAEHSLQTSQNFQLVFEMLESYLELLLDMQKELEKTLSPRNIKLNFQDMNLQIKHIPLNVGELFPPDYLYLTDKTPFETQEIDAPPTQILYEEGDIFIINMDDLQEELIPKVILSRACRGINVSTDA
ncbi:MAG: hypothetical protein CVU90_08120 [Firmicutes bacterium HGW-Firmicutes-15]|nr:MAG: hypothetical protein CVU90_08120 [Firmicutes bacterium HGW-Firmicutes-15]